MGPTKSPEKELFPEFPEGNLTLGGVRFPGANPSGKLALRWFPPIFFLNIKLPFWDIDGATPGVAPSMWASSLFGEMTEVVLSQQNRDTLKPNFNK